MLINVYMRVSKDEYQLPEAIADSPKELADILHTTSISIRSAISHGNSTFLRVQIDDEED